MMQFAPDQAGAASRQKHGPAGIALNRVDGRLKVQGEATFSADFKFENLAYAALVYSTIGKGRITKLDRSAAEKATGVLLVLTHENVPKMNDPAVWKAGAGSAGAAPSDLPILRDAQIHWDGQPIAVVVAETQQQADYAASCVEVEYEAGTGAFSFDALKRDSILPETVMNEPPEVAIGDAEAAFKDAAFKVDNLYRTSRNNHNAIEPHATTAVWDGDESLTVYAATQMLWGVKNTLAKMYDLAPEKVRVIAPFVGGGFGGKGFWYDTPLCVAAAKAAGRPVKLAVPRKGVFRIVGGRTPCEQRVALGTNQDGKLTAIIHTGTTATTPHNNLAEQFSFPVRHLYAAGSFLIGQRMVYLDTIANTIMRAPGESIGTFALESAMDELARKIKIDPIELRRINEPKNDPISDTEFSHRALLEAYRRGAEKFGWKNAEPRSQRDGKWLVGQGVATAFLPYNRFPAKAAIRITAEGTAVVRAAAHEMGMGTATVQLQYAAQRLGLPIEKVSFAYGDTNLPESPPAGASNQTASIVAAVSAAFEKVHQELLKLAGSDSPLARLPYERTEARDGGLFSKIDASKGETYAAILQRAGKDFVEAEASTGPPVERKKYAMHSYGAQFCEVRVNEESGELRVSRWLASFDCGRILNPKTAVSQFRGGIIMGIGMALTEQTLFDERRGRIMNATLAEYHVPVNLDIPHIEVIYTDIPDEQATFGVHGIGEIGVVGAAAAIANAVYTATGKRIRELPITLDKLL